MDEIMDKLENFEDDQDELTQSQAASKHKQTDHTKNMNLSMHLSLNIPII